jgi:hypothetical protein
VPNASEFHGATARGPVSSCTPTEERAITNYSISWFSARP